MTGRIIARRLWPLLVLAIAVVVVAKLGSLGSAALDRTVVTMLINLVVVIGLYVFVGISGVFSFGQISFMAIGAYTAGILTIPVDRKDVLLSGLPDFLAGAHMGSVEATFMGGLVAAIGAAVLSLALMRMSGLVAALGTFAVLLIVNVVAKGWTDLTNGTSGMSAIPASTSVDRALMWAIGLLAVAFAFQESRIGARLRASREDDVAARSLGISVGRERTAAFVLSAFTCGIAGALYAQFLGSISPDAFFLKLTFLTIAMLVIGGTGSLAGAVVGTIVVSAVSEFLRRVESGFDVGSVRIEARSGLQNVALGIVMLAILVARPSGLTAGREIRWPLGGWELEWRRTVFPRRDRTDDEPNGPQAT